jgi:hypothetical protein
MIADMLRYLDYLSMKYPELVEMITIGKSTLGQPLKVVKVSTGHRTKKGETKPAVWIDGGEYNTSQICNISRKPAYLLNPQTDLQTCYKFCCSDYIRACKQYN